MDLVVKMQQEWTEGDGGSAVVHDNLTCEPGQIQNFPCVTVTSVGFYTAPEPMIQAQSQGWLKLIANQKTKLLS